MATVTVRAGTVTNVGSGYAGGSEVPFVAVTVPPAGTLATAIGATSNGTTIVATATCTIALEEVATNRLKCTNFGISAVVPAGSTINSVKFAYKAKKTGADNWIMPSPEGGLEGADFFGLYIYNSNGGATINEWGDSGACRYTEDVGLTGSYVEITKTLNAATEAANESDNFDTFCTATNLRDAGFTVEFGLVNADQSANTIVSLYDFYVTIDYTPPAPGAFTIYDVAGNLATGATDVELTPIITCTEPSGATSIQRLVSVNDDFSNPVADQSAATAEELDSTPVAPDLSYGTLYYTKFVATNSGGSTSSDTWTFTTSDNPERSTSLTSGLIARWDLNGPNSSGHWPASTNSLAVVTDTTPNPDVTWPGGDLREQNDVTVDVQGKRGAAANFGAPAVLCCVDQAALLFENSWSVEVWCKPLNRDDEQFMVSKRANTGTSPSTFEMALQQRITTGALNLYLLNSTNNNVIQVASALAPSSSVWSQVIVTCEKLSATVARIRFYLNAAGGSTSFDILRHNPLGASPFTANPQTATLDTIDGTKKHLVIGGNFPTTDDQQYSGSLDMVTIWNRAITAAEVVSAFNNNAGIGLGGINRRRKFRRAKFLGLI